jgi:YidC/Oxa1 family membrane protein insertase
MISTVGSSISAIFHPIFSLFGWLLAFFYSLIPNYGFAIMMLTIVIMAVMTPLTVKSTRGMVAMQKIQPEIKKLQVKYKGAENRQTLNEELMRLYKEENVNPMSSCLPMLVQGPFLFVLYQVIKGLSNTVAVHRTLTMPAHILSQPKYIPTSSKLYESIIAAHGQLKVFGFDMALKPFSHHSSTLAAAPYFVFVLAAVGLQYFQMAQINNRAKKTGQNIPSQQQAIQRFLPIMFAYIYFIIPAAVVLYMIVSNIIRIITQDVMFRLGVSNPGSTRERELPARVDVSGSSSSSAPKRAQNRSKDKRKRKGR